MLHRYLTGYATLRRFYDLRDEEMNLKEGEKPKLRPIARKKAAADCLLAVINSAADNIHGGLYDESRGSIVQVDGLLTLLGEALIFVDRTSLFLSLSTQSKTYIYSNTPFYQTESTPLLNHSQLFALLKAIEDLQTVTPRIYQECESCLNSTLASYHGQAAPRSPRELLKKSISNLTSSSGFSLVGSSMLEESEVSSNMGRRRSGSSGGGAEVRRGWDWRKGLKREAKGEDVLRILRLGLARDVARVWVGREDGV